MGEGAGAVVLEEYEHAKRRGARIYAELVGYGLSGDAYHITAPAEDGDGAYRCMKAAIAAPAFPRATSITSMRTALRRRSATRSNSRRSNALVGNAAGHIAMSSTKSSIGHLLGAAGAVEAIFCLLAMRDGILPPTINLDNPSVATAIDLVPHKAQKAPDQYRAVEFVRIWRHQCLAGVPPGRAIGPTITVSPYLLRTRLRFHCEHARSAAMGRDGQNLRSIRLPSSGALPDSRSCSL